MKLSRKLSTSGSPPVASPACPGSHAGHKGRKGVRNKFESPGGPWPSAKMAPLLLLDPALASGPRTLSPEAWAPSVPYPR